MVKENKMIGKEEIINLKINARLLNFLQSLDARTQVLSKQGFINNLLIETAMEKGMDKDTLLEIAKNIKK